MGACDRLYAIFSLMVGENMWWMMTCSKGFSASAVTKHHLGFSCDERIFIRKDVPGAAIVNARALLCLAGEDARAGDNF